MRKLTSVNLSKESEQLTRATLSLLAARRNHLKVTLLMQKQTLMKLLPIEKPDLKSRRIRICQEQLQSRHLLRSLILVLMTLASKPGGRLWQLTY